MQNQNYIIKCKKEKIWFSPKNEIRANEKGNWSSLENLPPFPSGKVHFTVDWLCGIEFIPAFSQLILKSNIKMDQLEIWLNDQP